VSNSDRKPYLSATVLDQDLLDDSQDNLVNELEMVAEIQTPTGFIYASDRNKYVGDIFYEALLKFPSVNRTIGDWLSPELEFSTITLEVSNADSRFNSLLQGGVDFGGWLQKSVEIKIGLRDIASTYTSVFKGKITEIGGTQRSTFSIKIVARDDFEKLDVEFPTESLTISSFPNLEDNLIGKLKPIIYGDWTTALNVESGSSIPTLALNGKDATVISGSTNLDLLISATTNLSFDATTVVLKRSSDFFTIDTADIVNIDANKNRFEIRASGNGGTTLIDGSAFDFKKGDKFFVRVVGKDLGSGGIYNDNIVWQARDILLTYTDAVSGDFDATWATFRDKATPAESAISLIKSRIYRDDEAQAITFALSLLEQVRLEAFVNRDLKLSISSYHFDDLVPVPSFVVRNWDVEKGTFKPRLDTRNNFNRTRGFFNFLPDINDNNNTTPFLRNSGAITLAEGKLIGKGIVFPNLYLESDAKNQSIEILRLASSYFEIIEVSVTPRSLLLELGQIISVDISIGAVIFSGVPCMVRSIGYDATGRIKLKLWSFQMTPFSGYEPGFAGTVGGFDAVITEE